MRMRIMWLVEPVDKDYAFIITYLSKLHGNSMQSLNPYGNFLYFLFRSIFVSLYLIFHFGLTIQIISNRIKQSIMLLSLFKLRILLLR